jgi:transposase
LIPKERCHDCKSEGFHTGHQPPGQTFKAIETGKVDSPIQRRITMRTRRRFSAEFKAKVALEAIKGQETVAELATKHELHPTQIAAWKREAVEKLAKVFDEKGSAREQNRDVELTKLHAKIGQLVVERDFLSKAFDR